MTSRKEVRFLGGMYQRNEGEVAKCLSDYIYNQANVRISAKQLTEEASRFEFTWRGTRYIIFVLPLNTNDRAYFQTAPIGEGGIRFVTRTDLEIWHMDDTYNVSPTIKILNEYDSVLKKN